MTEKFLGRTFLEWTLLGRDPLRVGPSQGGTFSGRDPLRVGPSQGGTLSGRDPLMTNPQPFSTRHKEPYYFNPF